MAAAASCCLAKGFVFAPSEGLLLQLLYDKVHYGHDHDGVPIVEYDLYGQDEPWEVWSMFGGGGGGGRGVQEKDLYFFTKLKKVSPNGCRYHRHVGDGGTWSSARSDALSTRHIVGSDGAPIALMASKNHLRYEKDGSPHHTAWLLAEFSLGHVHPRTNRFRPLDGQFVLCRLRKNYKQAPKAPQHPPAAAEYNHHQPNSNHAVAVGSKKPREGSPGSHDADDDDGDDQPSEEVVTVTKKPRKGPDRGGQESACNMGPTGMVGAGKDQECCCSAALSSEIWTTTSSVAVLDHGISERTGITVQQEGDDDDAGTSACSSSTAGVTPIPPNSSLTERTPTSSSSSSSYNDAFGYDQSFYAWIDQVLSDQEYQPTDCTGSVAMTTTNITSTESSNPLSCSSSDNAPEYESFCAWMDQVFTDQQAAADDYSTTGAVEQPPNCTGTTGAVEQPPNCTGTGCDITMTALNNSSTEKTPMSSSSGDAFDHDSFWAWMDQIIPKI